MTPTKRATPMQDGSVSLAALLLLLMFAPACAGSERTSPTPDAASVDATASGGATSGAGGGGMGGAPGSGGAGGNGTVGSGGRSNGGSGAGAGGDRAGTGGQTSVLYQPPAAIIGGACAGTPVPSSMPCSDAPVQRYCSLSEPSKVIMATCSAAGRSQCEVVDECEPGWHACTATDYVARGGRDVAPNFSATNRAWLAACVRDATGTRLKNEPCSVCGQDVGYPPSVEWWCDGQVVYAGGMEGDTLGVHTSPECMRVGENDAAHGAFWTMGFSGGAPTFVMCCLDAA